MFFNTEKCFTEKSVGLAISSNHIRFQMSSQNGSPLKYEVYLHTYKIIQFLPHMEHTASSLQSPTG
jgi:hypothetical protein